MKANKKTPTPAGKRPYKTTRLRVYGTVGEITMTVGQTGKKDSGTAKMQKTNP